jgi:hypothetical protein
MWNPFRGKKAINSSEFIKTVQKLEVKDGDIIILKCEEKLSLDSINRLKAEKEKFFKERGYNISLFVLEGGSDINVFTKLNQLKIEEILNDMKRRNKWT